MRPSGPYTAEFFAQMGKASDKWASYLPAYDFWFAKFRDAPVRILEIGVQNGGHLEVLARYFKNAELIIGCDIDPACATLKYEDKRIKVIIGDVNADEVERNVTALSDSFDIIIDDGSHTQQDIIASFARYFPKLKTGGIYLAEDLHTSYWQEFGGGLFDPLSAIGFFSRLVDVLNFEHWGICLSLQDFLSPYQNRYSVQFDIRSLTRIHTISFQNSICVITKEEVELNGLGTRIIVGNTANVQPMTLALDDRTFAVLDQSKNLLSSMSSAPEALLDEINRVKSSRFGRALWKLMLRLSKS